LLQRTKEQTILHLSKTKDASSITGAEFELIVFQFMVTCAKGTTFEGKLRHTKDREFPDIVAAGYFGVEVKATKKDDWTSVGNSVLESSRDVDVQKIYIYFGKLGGTPDVMFRNYEDCLKGIAVTHYPRYQIDMLLDEKDSIFHKMNTSYDEIRASKNPIKPIRDYYKQQLKEGDALWWMEDNISETPVLSPIIRSFSSLEATHKSAIKTEIFINFPEVFSASTTKFERVAPFLAAKYGVVSSNLRDNFTAGGQAELNFANQIVKVPKIVAELLKVADQVKVQLETHTEATLSKAWERELDSYSSDMGLPVPLSELYKAALANKIKFL